MDSQSQMEAAAAAAAWDPLTCLMTPRANMSPGGGLPAMQMQQFFKQDQQQLQGLQAARVDGGRQGENEGGD